MTADSMFLKKLLLVVLRRRNFCDTTCRRVSCYAAKLCYEDFAEKGTFIAVVVFVVTIVL